MLALPLLAQGLALTAGPISQCEVSVTNMQGKTLQIPMPGDPRDFNVAALDFEVAVLARFGLPPHQEVKFLLNGVAVESAAVLQACREVATGRMENGIAVTLVASANPYSEKSIEELDALYKSVVTLFSDPSRAGNRAHARTYSEAHRVVEAVAAMPSTGSIGETRKTLLTDFLERVCADWADSKKFHDLAEHLLLVGGVGVTGEMLYRAIEGGCAELVEMLLKANSQVNRVLDLNRVRIAPLGLTSFELPPLATAVRQSTEWSRDNPRAVAEVLLRYGADVNGADHGFTPLWHAVDMVDNFFQSHSQCRWKMVAFLLDNKADIYAEVPLAATKPHLANVLCFAVRSRAPDHVLKEFLARAERFEKQSPQKWRAHVESALLCAKGRRSRAERGDEPYQEEVQKAIERIEAYLVASGPLSGDYVGGSEEPPKRATEEPKSSLDRE